MKSVSWLALCLPLAFAQAADTASIQGCVRDGQGHPVAAVIVSLENERTTVSSQTGSDGLYHFSALRSGNYKLRVPGHSETVALAAGESRKLDLVVTPVAEFFDEPDFVVAGVTDSTNQGGHGSGMALRSSESLAKAAAGLGSTPDLEKGPLEVVREYQRAAQQDPSEPNLFRWGAELLTHEAAQPATQVFARGHRLFPQSVRMILGLAVSWYVRGSYDTAADLFFAACDLKPSDPVPYSFLRKVQNSEITLSAGYLDRMARLARLCPDDPEANYGYAAALWGRHQDAAQTESLLRKALRLSPQFGAAYLQLGILYQDQQKYSSAIAALQKAASASPEEAEPHYRLAQLYRRSGDSAKAERELQLSQELAKRSAAAAESERRAIPRFIWSLRESGAQP